MESANIKKESPEPSPSNDIQPSEVADPESTLAAVKAFLSALSEVFKQQNDIVKKMRLFKRLVDGITPGNTVGIEKVLTSFNNFFRMYNPNEEKIFYKLPKGAKVRYNERINLDVQWFVSQAKDEVKDSIVEHLEYIGALMVPDEKTREVIRENEKKKASVTTEGVFLKDMMKEAETVMETVGDTENPMSVVAALASKGVLNNMIGGLKGGIDSGKMDPKRLMDVLHATANNFFETAKTNMDPSEEVKTS